MPVPLQRIALRDLNPALIAAWEEAFEGVPGVEIEEGDIFEVAADAIVSPANSFGFMDGGIDLVYSRHFGWDLQDRLQARIEADWGGELPVGMATVVETQDPEIPFLICAPTMRTPDVVAGTMNAYLAFRATLRAVQQHNQQATRPITSILCPGLGTAVGHMPPRQCAQQMRMAYDWTLGGERPPLGTVGLRELARIQRAMSR